MTTDNTKQPEKNQLESMLSGITEMVAEVDSVLRGVYNTVTEIAEKAESIYDEIAYHRDSPPYIPNMGFLDGLDE